MRAACLMLILSNVLYFTWAQFIDIEPTQFVGESAAPQSIALATETTAQTASATSFAPPEVSENGFGADECVSVGPFPSLSEATRAAATLTAANFEVNQRVEQGELWAGYWVHVPDLSAPGAADAAIEQLRERGVADVFLMPSESTSILSLGIFVDPERATRRANVARELGLTVRIADRKRTGSLYWLDAMPTEPGHLLDAAMFPPEPGKIVRIELRPCPQQ